MSDALSPVVSVVMPAYNAEKYLGAAIESVLAQTDPRWELLIVNDGSTDGTAEVASRYTAPRVSVFHQENGGEAAARNTALRHSRGRYIAFLDADDEYVPDHLQTTVAYLEANRKVDAVYTDGHYVDAGGRRLCLLSSRRRGPFQGDLFEETVRSSDVFGPPSAVVLRADVIRGRDLYFDTGILFAPDWDFLARFAEASHVGYLDRIGCLYRIHQTNHSITNHGRRAVPLARCREKAIKLGRFQTCAAATRRFVFYDLLVNLRGGEAEEQRAITEWPEFASLPAVERARLFRLMASQRLISRHDDWWVRECLRRSSKLAPYDVRGALLRYAYRWHPKFCRFLVLLRRQLAVSRRSAETSPFGNIG